MATGQRPPFVRDRVAIRYFTMIKRQLDQAGIPYEECDTIIIGTLANALTQYENACDELERCGAIITTATAVKKSPWVEYSKDLQITIRDCLKQLNMTPASRKVEVDETDSKPDALSAFLDNKPKPKPKNKK